VGLLPGDILVLGSDGLFDNMWDSQLESIVREYIKVCIHSLALIMLHAAMVHLCPCFPLHSWQRLQFLLPLQKQQASCGFFDG
jgi:hypothetical protein